VVYLDSSALVKLVVREPESRALRAYLRREPDRLSCGLARTEVLRAVRPVGPAAVETARRVLRSIHLIRLDDALLDAAGMLEPLAVRSLDAIHLAAAQLVAPTLRALVTYDRRTAAAAASLGFPSPRRREAEWRPTRSDRRSRAHARVTARRPGSGDGRGAGTS
jgi:predicted nucleic acid-binding protein